MIRLNGTYYSPEDTRNVVTDDFPEWQQDIFRFLHQWVENDAITVRTSGSTGEPKEIQLTRTIMRASAQLTGRFLQWQGGESALLALPARYIAGKMMLVRAMEWNLDLWACEPTSVVDPDKPYHFTALTPMQAANSIINLHHFQQIILGGGVISPELENQFMGLPVTIYHTYGMTETASHVAMRKLGSAGFRALPGVSFAVNSNECLVIQTPFLSEPVVTNDLVHLLSDQAFEWKGRADNVINSGGIKIFPEELELKLSPLIRGNYFISSSPDSVLGQAVVLVMELDQQPDFSTIPPFERPKEIVVRQFRYTPTGKIDRKATWPGV
jgi:O-succinylbenzoic acid--CoA ligase